MSPFARPPARTARNTGRHRPADLYGVRRNGDGAPLRGRPYLQQHRAARWWALIAVWTGSTSVRRARYGSHLTVGRRTKSGRANGSALPAQPRVRCASTYGAIGSSAVRGRSTDEKTLRGERPGQPVSAVQPQITLTGPHGREAVIWRRKVRPSGEYRLSEDAAAVPAKDPCREKPSTSSKGLQLPT